MKPLAFSFILLFLSLYFMSCEKEIIRVTPSSQVTTRTHAINTLQELSISDPFEVYVTFSETERELRIEANDNLHSLIEVEEINGHLSIQVKDNSRISGQPVLKVYLTTNALQAIDAQGTAEVYLQNTWQTNEAEIELSGNSHLTGALQVGSLNAELTGASSLDIEGSTQQFDIEATGASEMTGFDFSTDQLTADLTGASELNLTVNDEMSVEATGASTVRYRGNAVITYQNLSGGSKIIRD